MNICSSLRSSQRCFVAALEHDNINLCLTFSVMTAQLATAITHIMHHIYDNNNNKKNTCFNTTSNRRHADSHGTDIINMITVFGVFSLSIGRFAYE